MSDRVDELERKVHAALYWDEATGLELSAAASALRELAAIARDAEQLEVMARGYMANAESAEATVARLQAELAEAREALRTTYPATPVDCLISELRDSFFPVLSKTSVMTLATFEKRIALFKAEVSAGATDVEAADSEEGQ